MQPETINLCRTEHISVCIAENNQEQHDCNFYEKSYNANRCMYFMFDEICDCLDAQTDARDLA